MNVTAETCNVTEELIVFFGCGRHELEAALAIHQLTFLTNSLCVIRGQIIYLMFERLVLTPIMVGSFMDTRFIIQSTVAFVAVEVKASTFTDLGVMCKVMCLFQQMLDEKKLPYNTYTIVQTLSI